MLKANSYFAGSVQSVGFERLGRKQSVGGIDSGEYRFKTDAPERMTVVSGELEAKLEGTEVWVRYAPGTYFEVAGSSSFEVRAHYASAYLCEYL